MTAAAAAAFFALEESMPPRRPSNDDEERDPTNEEPFSDWTAKELSLRAIHETIALGEDVKSLSRSVDGLKRLEPVVNRLSDAIEALEKKLTTEYEDTQTRELNTLRTESKKTHSREAWIKHLLTGIVAAVAIAEILRLLGLEPAHLGH